MIKTKSAGYLILMVMICFYHAQNIRGAQKMGDLIHSTEIDFDEIVVSLFPVSQDNSFGMIAGKPDHETLRIGIIKNKHLKETVVPRKKFEPFNEVGYCIGNCDEMYLHQSKIISVVDLQKMKEILTYKYKGFIAENEFLKSKMVDENKKIVLTVFSPYYEDELNIKNFCWSLTLEDMMNKKRIKALPISTISGDYQTAVKSDFANEPNVFFGPNYVIYRESEEYPWLAVDNNLEYIEHPLKEILNSNKQFFPEQFVSIEISRDKPYAVAVCYDPLNKKRRVAMIQWNKSPAILPVSMKYQKDEEADEESLTLSPSGKWAYFTTSHSNEGMKYYLMYVNTDLPGGCMPPVPLKVSGDFFKATWITNPEGLVINTGKSFLYWNLADIIKMDF